MATKETPRIVEQLGARFGAAARAVRRWHETWLALRAARYRHLAEILDPPGEPARVGCDERHRCRRDRDGTGG